MPTNPYATLGLRPDATPAQVKSAYLKLAKKHHPDVNPGDKKAEERFKTISAAHDLLSDPDKRAKFDRGEIDATGQERGPAPGAQYTYRRGPAGGGPGMGAQFDGSPFGAGAGNPAFADMFAGMFRQAQGGHAHHAAGAGRESMRGSDQRYRLTVSFVEAAVGAAKLLTLPDGRSLDVTVPPGLAAGQVLRLRGQGDAGWNGGGPGDALIEVDVSPHKFFRREGDDIHLDLPVTAAEAALGAKIAVPTLAGPVNLVVPPHSDTGRQLRLRGRGIPAHAGRPAGDLYVSLKIVLGTPDAELEAALVAFYARKPLDPRAEMKE